MTRSNLQYWNDFGDHLIPVQSFMDNVIDHAEGSYLVDIEGNRILDLASGQFCNILGHSHPRFTEALRDELGKCLHTGSQYATDGVLKTAQKISRITPPGLDRSIILSTGSEANEFALRVAKAYTNRSGVIGFDRGYYGISLATRSLSAISDGHIDFSPKVGGSTHIITPHCRRCPLKLSYPSCGKACLDLSVELLGHQSENVAAIIVETIVSAGGMIYPDKDYLQSLQALARDIGALFIVDEAQTGFGRCGQWFDCENLGLEPDILVFSKTSGNGYPSAGVVINETIYNKIVDRGFYHLSSHQNDPVTARAISTVIDIIEEDNLLQACRDSSDYFLGKLNELAEKHPNLDAVRGRGLMIAFELVKDKATKEPYMEMLAPFVLACKQAGVHITYSYYEGALRLIPAINITREELDFALGVFDEKLGDLASGKIDMAEVRQKNKVIQRSQQRGTVRQVASKLWETSPQFWAKKIRDKFNG